jgi:hypothetical protein
MAGLDGGRDAGRPAPSAAAAPAALEVHVDEVDVGGGHERAGGR